MSLQRITISLPGELLDAARAEVDAGRSASVSAVVTGALSERVRRQRMEQVLDEIEAEHGSPGPEAQEWARRALAED